MVKSAKDNEEDKNYQSPDAEVNLGTFSDISSPLVRLQSVIFSDFWVSKKTSLMF